MTFDEIIIHGIGYREGKGEKLSPHEIESGMPWHFRYRDVPFSQEDNDTYVVTPRTGSNLHFKRGQRIQVDDPHAVHIFGDPA